MRTRATTITRKKKWEEKQLYGHFKWLTSDISHEKTWTWLRKGNLKRETESLLIAAQNNAIRTNHIKAKIDKMQQNCRCRLCGERDKTINHISKCSKLAQKEYKTRYDWVDKVIHSEFHKKLKFDHTNKPSNCPREWDAQNPLGFWDTNGSPNLSQMTRSYNNQRWTTEWNWKNVKRRISTSTLLGNWKSCGTWKWQLYQL